MKGRRVKHKRNSIRLAGAAVATLAALPALAQADRPQLNFYGMTGAIDTPTALSQPDAELSLTSSYFGQISRNTAAFQILPGIQAAFRYSKYADLNFAGFDDYFDRSFDLSFRLMREGRYLPAVKLGLQDFAGTGISSAEYIVATKTFAGGDVAVSAGLGWGRMGSSNALGSTGTRAATQIGFGGDFNADQWFRGDYAPFGSVTWNATSRLALMAEYSSDAYALEAGEARRTTNPILERESDFSFGAAYRVNDYVALGAYYLYGAELGFKLNILASPRRPPVEGSIGPAPQPVNARPARASNPAVWSESWAANPRTESALLSALVDALDGTGLTVEALEILNANAVEVRFRNRRYDAEAQAVGRMARALSRTMPSSVETFRIVPTVDGNPASGVVIRRSDLEALVAAPDAAAQLRAVSGVVDVAGGNPGATLNPEVFPRFDWSVSPFLRRVLFNPDEPVRLSLGLRARASFEPRPGIVFSGSVGKVILGNADESTPNDSALEPVRTNYPRYYEEGDPAIETLQGAYYFKPAGDIYGRVSVGYLERMFGGVSTEILWKPANSRLALGAELNYVGQRDFDGGLGFQDYRVTTGHLSAYYELPHGFEAQIDVGRYLAGDDGATLSVLRRFDNGWEVGAFATKTNVSAEDFGEGSFDKGISVEIPLSWFTGTPSRRSVGTTLRPTQRDGGARLSVGGRLYDSVRDYHRGGLDESWGRVWR